MVKNGGRGQEWGFRKSSSSIFSSRHFCLFNYLFFFFQRIFHLIYYKNCLYNTHNTFPSDIYLSTFSSLSIYIYISVSFLLIVDYQRDLFLMDLPFSHGELICFVFFSFSILPFKREQKSY